jgi:hypothetical protein
MQAVVALTQYRSEHRRDGYLSLAIAVLGSIIMLATTGHLVGVRNDIYFQPILAGLYDEAQFAGNAYIQSLHHYSSGLWLALSGAERVVDTYWLLLCLHFISVVLSFLGFLACASLLGIRSWQQRLFLTGLLCATPFLRGQSLAGDGGLFINYFTHSEINNGLTLLALYLLLCRRLIAAVVVLGIIFFLNAFVGVWDAIMLVGVAGAMVFSGAITWRQLLLRSLIGAVPAAALAFPILYNVFTNPDFGQSPGFDYTTYLEQFWPYHFLIWDIGWRDAAGLGAMITLGIISFSVLGRRAFFFLVAFVSFAVVYAIGIVVPYLTHNAVFLNLHLLRVSTMLQLLSTFGCLALATRWWFSEKAIQSNILAPVLVLVMCVPVKMTTLQPALHATAAFLIIAAAQFHATRQFIPEWLCQPTIRLRVWVSVIVVGSFTLVGGVRALNNFHEGQWLAEWRSVGQWARSNTSTEDVFLVPTWNLRGAQSPQGTEENEAILNSGAFEAVSHRAVWIDFRQGAAVMWSPSYYQLWYRRVREVNSLNSITAQLDYAAVNGIKYLIDVCRPETSRQPIFATRRLCVYPTK